MKPLRQQAIRRLHAGPQPRIDIQFRRRHSGAVALEFAVVLPMLLLVLTGILEFGRVGALGIRLAQAARAGAEYGALHPPDDFTLSDWGRICELRAREVLADQPGIDSSRLEVQCTFTSASPLSRSEVRIRHPFPLLLGWDAAPGNLVLQRTAVLPVVR
jgi:hypothetical protein